jgi:hypothetical protein
VRFRSADISVADRRSHMSVHPGLLRRRPDLTQRLDRPPHISARATHGDVARHALRDRSAARGAVRAAHDLKHRQAQPEAQPGQDLGRGFNQEQGDAMLVPALETMAREQAATSRFVTLLAGCAARSEIS